MANAADIHARTWNPHEPLVLDRKPINKVNALRALNVQGLAAATLPTVGRFINDRLVQRGSVCLTQWLIKVQTNIQ